MGVSLLVGVGVVLAMVGHPVHDRTLNGERPEDREQIAQGAVGLEGAMGQQAVVADRDAQPRRQIHAGEQLEVERIDAVIPQQDEREQEREERQRDGDHVCVSLEACHGY